MASGAFLRAIFGVKVSGSIEISLLLSDAIEKFYYTNLKLSRTFNERYLFGIKIFTDFS